MNPENCGTHISLRHTSMWRNPLFGEKKVPHSQSCHKQLNECTSLFNEVSSTTNESWRTRNNFMQSNLSNPSRGFSLRTKVSKVDEVLEEEIKQSGATKALIKSLMIDKDQFEKSQKLVEGMTKLKEMKLLTGKDLHQIKLPGVIRTEHIYNDYHVKSTNPGYSRSELGRMFSK